MAIPVRAPGASGSAPGRIIEWYRPDGAELRQGDPIACVECDDVVFDLDAEADGVLHQRAEAGGPTPPTNVVAFIAERGESLPAGPEPAPPHLPPIVNDRQPDFVPGMPIPLRRGALGAPKEFTRGGAWDRVFGSDADGHIDNLWPHTEESPQGDQLPADDQPPPADRAATRPVDVLGFPVPAEPPAEWPREVDQLPPAPEFAVPAVEEVEAFSYFEGGPESPESEEPGADALPDSYEAPGVEVSFAEVAEAAHWLDDLPPPPVATAPAPLAPVIAAAPVYIPPPPLYLRTTVRMTEARKLCDQLGREWREAPARPENEDLILRAIARAASEQAMVPPDGGVAGLVFPVAGGDTVAALRGAARGSFKEQVARLAQAPREATFAACSYSLVSFRHFGIEEATPHLAEGHAVAFAVGALRAGASTEKSEIPSPVLVLTMAYNPDVLSMGDAAILFARVSQLIEAPYALLAD